MKAINILDCNFGKRSPDLPAGAPLSDMPGVSSMALHGIAKLALLGKGSSVIEIRPRSARIEADRARRPQPKRVRRSTIAEAPIVAAAPSPAVSRTSCPRTAFATLITRPLPSMLAWTGAVEWATSSVAVIVTIGAVPLCLSAKRVPPSACEPVVYQNVKYSAEGTDDAKWLRLTLKPVRTLEDGDVSSSAENPCSRGRAVGFYR